MDSDDAAGDRPAPLYHLLVAACCHSRWRARCGDEPADHGSPAEGDGRRRGEGDERQTDKASGAPGRGGGGGLFVIH
jgi:hypothetical protein